MRAAAVVVVAVGEAAATGVPTAEAPLADLDSLTPAVAETRRLARAARDRDAIDAVAAEAPSFPDHLDEVGVPLTVAWRSYGADYAEAMADALAEVLAGPPRRYAPGESPTAYRAGPEQALYLWPAWAHTPADALTADDRAAVEAFRPGLLDEMRVDGDGLSRGSRLESSEDGVRLYVDVATWRAAGRLRPGAARSPRSAGRPPGSSP